MMNAQDIPFVSIIIPVFNDAARLQICLEALEHQTYPKSRYEVVVVDNASDNGEELRAVVARFPEAIATFEPRPGSYAARNRGIQMAKGTVLAFTDADCIPATDWLEQGIHQLQQTPNCGLVAGKIELFFQDPNHPTPVERYESITAFPQEKQVTQSHFGATANVFTYKTVMDQVGLFDADLTSGGDVEWGQRVFARGFTQVYGEHACVAHPARHSWQALYRRTIRLAAGKYTLQQKQATRKADWNRTFLISLVKNSIPPLMFVFNTFQNPNIQGIRPKLEASLAMFFVRYTTAFEIIKLRLGGESARV